MTNKNDKQFLNLLYRYIEYNIKAIAHEKQSILVAAKATDNRAFVMAGEQACLSSMLDKLQDLEDESKDYAEFLENFKKVVELGEDYVLDM